MARIDDVLDVFREALLAKENMASAQMADYYLKAIRPIEDSLSKLQDKINEARANGEEINQSWLFQEGRMQSILDQIRAITPDFANQAQKIILDSQTYAANLGQQASLDMLRAALEASPIPLTFNRLPKEALETFVGRASNGSPLADLFDGFGPEAAQNVKQALFNGLATGSNPNVTARYVRDALNVPLWRARTISRTETLQAYRRASHDTYKANSDVVGSWIWVAELGPDTCEVCIAMNGTEHSLEEFLDSHPNCRCSQAPRTKSWDDILPDDIDTSDLPETRPDIPSGIDWFDNQSESVQRQILGNAKYEAWSNGDVKSIADFIGVKHDADWGTSRYSKSLKQLGI